MPERALLRDRFNDILHTAEGVAAEYDRLAHVVDDPAKQTEFARLARGQRRHLELAERLLEIVEE